MNSTIETRKELSTRLESLGFSSQAIEIICKETAPARHRARCQKIQENFPTAKGRLLCLLDTIGVGGIEGVSGAGTMRLEQFLSFGKGRKQASDGKAWSAAIASNLPQTVTITENVCTKNFPP